MTTPSKTQFEDWLSISEIPYAKGLDGPIQEALIKDGLSDPSILIREFAEGHIAKANAHWGKLLEHPVKKWLNGQPGYTRAINLLNGRRRPAVEPKENAIERLIGDLNDGLDPGQIAARARVISLRSFRRVWLTQVVQSLHNYLFYDHQAVHSARTKLNKNIDQILTLVDEVAPFLSTTTSSVSADLVFRRVVAWRRHVDPKPARDLKTKAEISFVSQMYRANRTIARSPKPAVIAELMTIECFSRQFDARHIARICSELEDARKKSIDLQKVVTVLGA